jgi:hypothetical protein
VKLNAEGTAADYSTRFGGGDDYAYGIAVDPSAGVYLIGYTVAQSFPVTPGAYQTTKTGNSTSMFVARIDLGPKISGATVDGKNLIVSGEDFEEGAVIVLDGQDQRTLSSDQNPTGSLTGKKTAKRIAPGQPVNLQVRNPDGVLSPTFPFQRQD